MHNSQQKAESEAQGGKHIIDGLPVNRKTTQDAARLSKTTQTAAKRRRPDEQLLSSS